MREFSQQELQAVQEAERQLRAQGQVLITEPEDGQENVDHNAEQLTSYFSQTNDPITVESALEAFRVMKDLRWKSAPQVEYETLYNQLTKDQQNAFGAWWVRQKQTLVLEGDEGYENASQIIAWMRGKSFDARGFDLAVSNLAGSSRRPLHWAQTREQVSSGRPGHAPSGSFMSKDDTNLSPREHARRAAEAAAKASGKSTPAPGTDFRALSEGIRAATHSRTEQLQRMFVTSDRGVNDWEQTYYSRRRAAGL